MNAAMNHGYEPPIAVRKRTELSFTPSSPIVISASPSTATHQQHQQQPVGDSEFSTSLAKKSSIPMPINGQIILRKDGNQTTNNDNQHPDDSSKNASKIQQSHSNTEDVSGDEDPLCDDILSCISALDEVIAEFDDPVSLPSLPSPTPSPPVPAKVTTLPQTQAHEKTRNGVSNSHNTTSTQPLHPKPAFSRLITTLSTHPQEPSVIIMQKESQTVTKIQIGSGQASGKASSSASGTTSSSTSYVTSTPTSSPGGVVSVVSWKNPQVIVSQNNNSVSSVPSQHYSKRQQAQPQPPPIKPQVIVQLKQSDFTPALATTRESTFSTFKGSPTATLEGTRSSDEEPSAVLKNSFTNYELIFPKSPTPGPRAHKTGQSVALKRFPADIIITPHYYAKQNNKNFASEVTVGAHPSQMNGSSYPKIKQRQDLNTTNVMESQSQSVKVRQAGSSPAASAPYKPIPASFANNNIVIVDAKDQMMQQEDMLKERWNFLSDENLPRSLRKTRKVILDEDEEGNVRNVETSGNANQINPCTAAVRKTDQIENARNDQDSQSHVHAVAPVRNQKKQKLTSHAGESESKKLRQQQQVLKKGIDQQSPHHKQNQNRNPHPETDIAKNRNVSQSNNKNTYSKESGQSSRKTILSNFMFFPLTGASSPEDEIVCEQVEAAINKINNNVQPQQQGGNIKSQINSKPIKNNGPPSAVPRGPSALPVNVAQLDVDDGYLSMINRHDPPIIWPETYIESETFTPEELKKLSSMKQERHVNGRELKPNKLMSSLTTSEEKTDYFSDDSLENEQVDEAENLHLSYVIATHDVDRNVRRIQSDVNPPQLSNAQNMWRKSTSSSCESPITPSSPVKKPLAFFIPLASSEPGMEKKEPTSKVNANAAATSVIATKDEKTSQINAAKADSMVVAPVVNTILENALRVGVQEASAINYLLASAASDYDENEDTCKIEEFHQKSDLIQAPIEDMPLIEPPTLPTVTNKALEHGSSNEIFETNQEFPVRTSQYEADIEDIDDEVSIREVSPTKDSEKVKKKRKSKTAKNHEEWKQEMEFVEDFDQPPPFIPAPPPAMVAHVPKITEHVTALKSTDQSLGHLNGPVKPNRNSSPLPVPAAQIPTTRGSMEHLSHNGVDQHGKILFHKSVYHRSVDPDVDYRMKMQRQASRSHENLLDIRSRQRDFLTPRGNQGQSCTLPPNTMPPVNQRRHSTFRQFLGGIFKRSKKSDASFLGDVPDSPFEDIQFSFSRKNIYPAVLPETTPNPNSHDLPYNERKLSFTNSPHGSQRSTRSTPVKRGLLSRIFHRKDK